MREVELFKRGTAQTLIPLFAKNEELTLQSPVSEYERLHTTIRAEEPLPADHLCFAKVKGEGMIASGIFPEDMLVVDQSLQPVQGDIVIGEQCGEFIIRSYYKKDDKEYLLADNAYSGPVEITEKSRFKILGVVPHSVIDQRRRNNARIRRFEMLLR
jgi:DNA polymerase V